MAVVDEQREEASGDGAGGAVADGATVEFHDRADHGGRADEDDLGGRGQLGGLHGALVDLHDARILIADDVADTGHTLRSVELFCEGKVGDVRTCVIYEKSHSVVKCDYVWRRTDLWINFPWSDKPPVAKRDWKVVDA